jgi:hypothetical protein
MGPSLHELTHNWASKLEILDRYRGDPEKVCPGHWGWTSIGGHLGGWKHGSLQALSNGSYQAKGPNNTKKFGGLTNGNSGVSSNSYPYSNFELYMMGLIGDDEVGQEIKIAQDFKWKDIDNGTFEASTIHSLTMEEIIADAGVRSPSYQESQKNFRSMYVVVSEEKLKPNEWGYIDQELHRFQLQGAGYSKSIKLPLLAPALPLNFWEATQGKATITFGQVDTFLTSPATLSALVPVTESDEIPKIPQQSLSKIIRTDGTASDSTISIGASSDDGATSNTTFTVDDEVTLTAKVYPDSDDVGEKGELYVVMRSTVDGKKTFTALNEDGVWEAWNASLKSLPSARYVESLEALEEVLVYSGTITAGDRLFYVGYSPFTEEGKPVITTSQSPFKITVSE